MKLLVVTVIGCLLCVWLYWWWVARYQLPEDRTMTFTSGDMVLVLSKKNLPRLLKDQSPDAALQLYHYYRAFEEDEKSAEMWAKEWEKRTAAAERRDVQSEGGAVPQASTEEKEAQQDAP